MEDEFGNLIVVMVQLVFHYLVTVALLAEIHEKVAIVCIVGVRTRALGRITVIVATITPQGKSLSAQK